MASCTSQQSVSNAKDAAKCASASALGAAGIAATADGMSDLLGGNAPTGMALRKAAQAA
jgi:hypothetical protein